MKIEYNNITPESLADMVSTAGAEFDTDTHGRNCYVYGVWVYPDGHISQFKENGAIDHVTVYTPLNTIYAELGMDESDDEDGNAIFNSESFQYDWFREVIQELYMQVMKYYK